MNGLRTRSPQAETNNQGTIATAIAASVGSASTISDSREFVVPYMDVSWRARLGGVKVQRGLQPYPTIDHETCRLQSGRRPYKSGLGTRLQQRVSDALIELLNRSPERGGHSIRRLRRSQLRSRPSVAPSLFMSIQELVTTSIRCQELPVRSSTSRSSLEVPEKSESKTNFCTVWLLIKTSILSGEVCTYGNRDAGTYQSSSSERGLPALKRSNPARGLAHQA